MAPSLAAGLVRVAWHLARHAGLGMCVAVAVGVF
jgi:hypothetical protein